MKPSKDDEIEGLSSVSSPAAVLGHRLARSASQPTFLRTLRGCARTFREPKTALDEPFTAAYSRRLNMNKRAIIRKIKEKLIGELEVYFRAAQYARAEATHEQNKAEHKYDTRGLEASYLARGQSKQAAELETAIAEFERLELRKFNDGDPIDLGAVVELELEGERSIYFLGPRAGGTEIIHDKKEILVITPQSPLGEQLSGRKTGETLQLKLGGETRSAKILGVE